MSDREESYMLDLTDNEEDNLALIDSIVDDNAEGALEDNMFSKR